MADYDIQVDVKSQYLSDQSQPEAGRYAYAYHVSIANRGDKPAKLLRRRWLIIDGNEKVIEVKGDGVVGQQPEIMPGEIYQYSSGTMLFSEIACMRGSYQMLGLNGEVFDAEVPTFTLSKPNAIH